MRQVFLFSFPMGCRELNMFPKGTPFVSGTQASQNSEAIWPSFDIFRHCLIKNVRRKVSVRQLWGSLKVYI